MQLFLIYFLKGLKFASSKVLQPYDWCISYLLFYMNGVEFKGFKTYGVPKINVGIGGVFKIGKNFRMHNRESSNPIGRFNRCSFIVGKRGRLEIGQKVGVSSIGIVCHESIIIGDNVNIGGNVIIYDTNFHSLNPAHRLDGPTDRKNTKTKSVHIGDNVFIGGHTTILKGVRIGDNSIVGAGSIVTRDIPKNEIWAGNPAKKIRNL
ncbi:acyltransferase [Maribacter sp. 2-571]|uniref:acyltransferase n=1 Tax=Maribacter sp. 2-571 TaxID=3417569 RepID=UPI003D33E275